MRNGKGPNCICFLIPNPDPLKSKDSQCLYVLDLVPGSSTFEYLTYLGNNDSSRPLVSVPSHYNLDWVWRDLPVPPFVDDPSNCRATMNCSFMLLDSSTMCVSEEGIGTYTFDMVSRKWSRAGNWALPFCGKAEYVPKLKLWFALSPPSSPHSLCALDLPANAMDFESPPDLRHSWDYPTCLMRLHTRATWLTWARVSSVSYPSSRPSAPNMCKKMSKMRLLC
uniref:Uncharacterized protein n=1 Tax=Triticum urartu TaxID=4572 RepID=A0A8R7PAI2_TRIUA